MDLKDFSPIFLAIATFLGSFVAAFIAAKKAIAPVVAKEVAPMVVQAVKAQNGHLVEAVSSRVSTIEEKINILLDVKRDTIVKLDKVLDRIDALERRPVRRKR